jgi:hypothetical protein
MAVQTLIQIRRGTAAQWTSTNPTLNAGEWGYETDSGRYKIGDGTTVWNSLRYSSLLPKSSDITGASGINITFSNTSGVPVTIAVTGIQSTQINDFNTAVNALVTAASVSTAQVMNIVNSGLSEGSNIDLVYNTGTNILSISVTGLTIGTHVQAYDAGLQSISNLTTSSNNYLYTTASDSYTTGVITSFGRSLVDDTDASTARTTLGLGTIATYNSGDYSLSSHTHTSSNITDFNSSVSGLLGVKSLVAGTGIGITNNNGAQTINVTGIPSSLITDLGNIATTEVIGRTGIQLTYDAIYDKMYVDVTGVSFVGHTHNWSDISDASTKATLSELAYLSGVSAGTASASRALVLDSNKDITGIGSITTTGNMVIGGNLTVNGTTTTVNSTTVDIGDNIIRVNVSGAATQGGLEVRNSATSGISQLVWNTTNNRWEFGGNVYTSGSFVGSLSGNANTVTNGVYTTDSGTVTSTMIADNTIVNADINSSAGIAYSKLNLTSGIVNTDVSSSASIAYSKLNLSSSIVNSDVSSSASIAYSKLNLTSGIVNTDINGSASIADTKLATISSSGKVSNSATTATSSNTASAIVARDINGDFSAGTITATSFSGSGASLTGIDASNISTGTLNVSRLPTNIPVINLASSGVTIGSTTVNLGQTTTVLNGLSSISGTSAGSPTTLYYCAIDGGTP